MPLRDCDWVRDCEAADGAAAAGFFATGGKQRPNGLCFWVAAAGLFIVIEEQILFEPWLKMHADKNNESCSSDFGKEANYTTDSEGPKAII